MKCYEEEHNEMRGEKTQKKLSIIICEAKHISNIYIAMSGHYEHVECEL